MPFADLPHSPLAGGPARIHYREYGDPGGEPLLFLHGGWGYAIYPFDRQLAALAGRFRIVIPDRSGYGQSGRLRALPADFHHHAAAETVALLETLSIEGAILWGHSDGAVISALLGLAHPGRFRGILLEAFHYYRNKPGSREFFRTMSGNPQALGERVTATLAADHGNDYWKRLIELNGLAWLEIARHAQHPKDDLYGGRLSQLATPCVFLHGSRDPRTEPDELAAIEREAPGTLRVIEGGGHSPHSESGAAAECGRLAREFISRL